ncbi:MAG TPA: PEP-CTERM sorting domain-containing protein [Gammaproteobacteria bacterium]|nr:PEP-CTERM sorting domain-containing protein [Gammaproteobacteria bacterium]
MKRWKMRLVFSFVGALLFSSPALAGPIFLTGHDPDFHAPGSLGAGNLLRTALDFVTGGTAYDPFLHRFLWVEARIAPPLGHRVGENGLTAIGLQRGVHYERVSAAELASVDFSSFSAIAVASSFGGLLTRAELDALIARKDDIAAFVNSGGGLLALAECYPCGANLLSGPTAPDLFGFIPLDGVVSVATSGPYSVTSAGAFFGLAGADVNDPTHNAFGSSPSALTVLDVDVSNGLPVTLAGSVNISGGGFSGSGTSVPEPATLALMGLGLFGLGMMGSRSKS